MFAAVGRALRVVASRGMVAVSLVICNDALVGFVRAAGGTGAWACLVQR